VAAQHVLKISESRLPCFSEDSRNDFTMLNLGSNMRFSTYSRANSGAKYFSKQRRMVLSIGPSSLFPTTVIDEVCKYRNETTTFNIHTIKK
jgi:hypothetical protein